MPARTILSRDCPGGQFCGCDGLCYTPPACDSDAECGAHERCDGGQCLERNECANDADCPSGFDCRQCACFEDDDQPPEPPGPSFGAVASTVRLDEGVYGMLAHEHRDDRLVYAVVAADGTVSEPTTVDAGPGVGDRPSAVFVDGLLGVAYRDRLNSGLRFAVSDDRESWRTMAIDDSGNSGEHSALGRLSDGRWAVAYSSRGDGQAELRVALSGPDAPTTTADWRSRTLATGADATPNSSAVPVATGLYPSLAELDGVLYIAFYDGAAGDLVLLSGDPDGDYESVLLAEGETRSGIPGAGDVGAHARLVATPDRRLGVVWVDRIAGTLWYGVINPREGAGTLAFTGQPELVSPGRQDTPPRLVGADASLVYRSDGSPLVAFQDQSNGNLELATPTGSEQSWHSTVVTQVGFSGFSPSLFVESDGTWVVQGALEEVREGVAERVDVRAVPF